MYLLCFSVMLKFNLYLLFLSLEGAEHLPLFGTKTLLASKRGIAESIALGRFAFTASLLSQVFALLLPHELDNTLIRRSYPMPVILELVILFPNLTITSISRDAGVPCRFFTVTSSTTLSKFRNSL